MSLILLALRILDLRKRLGVCTLGKDVLLDVLVPCAASFAILIIKVVSISFRLYPENG